jgi:hypothetical protein
MLDKDFCRVCGSMFERLGGPIHKLYCSRKCMLVDYKERNGDVMRAQWSTRRRRALEKLNAEANLPEKPCETCGRMYQPKIYGKNLVTRFCSLSCRTIANNKARGGYLSTAPRKKA